MSSWFVYLLVKLDAIQAAFISLSALSLFYIIMIFVITWERCPEEFELKDFVERFKRFKFSLIFSGLAFFFSTSVSIFMPDTKQACVIYLLPKIVNSETMDNLEDLPANLTKFLNKKSQAWINGVMEEKE